MIGNLAFLLAPEQMGVWCMPVPTYLYPNTTDERVILNVVNSLYFSMHLSSKMEGLTKVQQELLDEGIAYYRSIAKDKSRAIPVFPKGLLAFDDESPVLGIKTADKLYLSVYNLSANEQEIELDLSKYNLSSCTLAYPKQATNTYAFENGVFKCELQGKSARAFEFLLLEDASVKVERTNGYENFIKSY